MTRNYGLEEPLPSPTMPPLEDAEARFEYREIGTTEILLPIEIRAKLIRTFPRLNQHTTVLPHVAELATNGVNRQKSDNDAEQPERAKSQKNNSLSQTTDMGSHSETVKPDTTVCITISRLQTRRRLWEITSRRRQASNNNNGEHTLLDQDIVIHSQSTPTNPISETHPLETKWNNATNNTYEPTADKNIKGYTSRDADGINVDNDCRGDESKTPTPRRGRFSKSDPSPAITPSRRRNTIKNTHGYKVPGDLITIYESEDEDKLKEDPVDAWALQQHRAGNRDPRFLSSSIVEYRAMKEKGMWPLNGAEQKSEPSSWPTSHLGKKLLRSLGTKPLQCTEVRFASFVSGGFITAVLVNPPERKMAKRTSVQCAICEKWAHGLWCDHKGAPQTTPTDNNDNIRDPVSDTAQETIYIDEGALSYYEYSEINTTKAHRIWNLITWTTTATGNAG